MYNAAHFIKTNIYFFRFLRADILIYYAVRYLVPTYQCNWAKYVDKR
jgi:hypothetical protein